MSCIDTTANEQQWGIGSEGEVEKEGGILLVQKILWNLVAVKNSMLAKWDIIKLQENTMNNIFYGIRAHPCQRKGNARQYLQDNMNSCFKDKS